MGLIIIIYIYICKQCHNVATSTSQPVSQSINQSNEEYV